MLDKISKRIHSETLAHEIVGLLKRERRPLADYLDIQNELAKAKKLPKPMKNYFFGWKDSNEIVEVCQYNKEWTEAYIRLLTKRISDDIFRIMTVRLLEPLVFESIQFTLNLFNSNSTVIREAKLATKEADELEGLKRNLVAAYKNYTNKDPSEEETS